MSTEPAAPKTSKTLLALVAGNLLVTSAFGVFIVTHTPAAHDAAADAKGGGKPTHNEEKPAADKSAQGEEGKEGKAEEGANGEESKAKEKEKGEEAGAEKPGDAAPDEGAKKSAGGTTARLEDIIVRLRNPEIDRYARLTLDVEMANSSQLAQLQTRAPQIRDAVITALSEKTFEDLRGADGLASMKTLLLERIDAVVPGDVSAVYVSGFIVQ